ncbi:hypothetical protein SDC9_171997 [bioreactor metagenome]|uniref:Uncharacterized protein n=1 Tax=bioreactor metagenome TaxID=1076179 RepID=A0A645GEL8_9ZZZZ
MKKLGIILLTAVNLFFISNNTISINLEKNSEKDSTLSTTIVGPLDEKDPIIFSIGK